MFEQLKKEIIETGVKLDKYGLIALSGGNVSARTDSGEILITPSGMEYSDITEQDILVLDPEGKVLEGKRKPSSDTEAVLYIMEHRPDIGAVIHTHQPYATAVGLVEDKLRVNLTTLANCAAGDVNVSPYSSPGSLDMGVDVVNHIGSSLAIILANHGVVTVGKNLKQALYAAVYMEEAAKTYMIAKSTGLPMREMTPEQIQQAIDIFKFYGQDEPPIPKELLRRV